jgi:MFS family permease
MISIFASKKTAMRLKNYFNYFTKQEWQLILLVGMGYFMNLFILRGQNIMKDDFINYEFLYKIRINDTVAFPGQYLFCNTIGSLLGVLIWGYFADKYSRKKALIVSMVTHLIIILTTFFLISNKKDAINSPEIVFVWRFLTGVLVAGEYGIGLTLVVENIARTKRIWATALVTALGILGIVFFAGIHHVMPTTDDILLIGAIISSVLVVARFILLEESIEMPDIKTENQKVNIIKHWRSLIQNREQLNYLFLLILIGLPQQFIINFIIQNAGKIANEAMNIDDNFLTYYISFFFSVLGFAYFYSNYQRLSKIFFHTLLWIQGVSIVIFVTNFANGFFINIFEILLLGSGVGIWGLICLKAVEESNSQWRASAAIFVSNLIRAAIVLLVFGGALPPDNKTMIFSVVIVIIGLALLATFSLKETFLPKLKKTNDEKSESGQILRSTVIESIKKAQETLFGDKNVENYLKSCSDSINNTILYRLNVLLFSCYSYDEKNKQINRSDFKCDEELTNLDNMERIRLIARDLINKQEAFSFTGKVLSDNIPGVILFYSPKPNRFIPAPFSAKDYEIPEGFILFDLATVAISDEQAKEFWQHLPKDVDKIIEFLDNISNVFDETILGIFIDKLNERVNTTLNKQHLKRALILHKIDAMGQQSGYFSYFIGPYTADQNGILFLITSYPATVNQLHELSSATTIIMNALFVVSAKEATYKETYRQTMHNQNTVLAAVNTSLEGIKTAFETKNEDKFNKNWNTTCFYFDSLYHINAFFYALERVGNKRENIAIFYALERVGNKRLLSDSVKEQLSCDKVNLAMLICDRLTTLIDGVNNIVFVKKYYDGMQEYLETVKKSVSEQLKDIEVVSTISGLQIILHDILTNAVRYNNVEEPVIAINWYPTIADELPESIALQMNADDYQTLSFRNKGTLPKAEYRYILDQTSPNNQTSTSNKLGINTIKRIIAYNGLGQSGLPWYYTPKKDSFDQAETTIFLLIPKKDINNDEI